jgi:hypothetical protein
MKGCPGSELRDALCRRLTKCSLRLAKGNRTTTVASATDNSSGAWDVVAGADTGERDDVPLTVGTIGADAAELLLLLLLLLLLQLLVVEDLHVNVTGWWCSRTPSAAQWHISPQ